MTAATRILLTGLAAVAFGLVASGALDQWGEEYADAALKRSLTAFGIARALNGVISVAQGTEVALQPAGVGVTLTPGEILDPVNDLVERFSWIMLLSSASIGILQILLMLSAWPWFSAATCLLVASAAALLWRPGFAAPPAQKFLVRAALLLVVLRLAAPLVSITSEWIYQAFLEPQYDRTTAQIEQTTDRLDAINAEAPDGIEPEDESFFGSAKQFYRSAADQMDISARIERYQQAVADISRDIVELIALFLFQTVILPLLFLAGLYALLKRLLD